jgi:ABC-type dipeptide/oligopeptide/nickel transport system permease component
MIKYIIKRLFQSVLVILLVVCVVFSLLRLMPSDYFFTEDELMKFTESQKYAKLERLGLMKLCPTCEGTGLVNGEACPACRENELAVKGTGYMNRSVLAQLGDFFGDMLQVRVFNAKGKEVKSVEPMSVIKYLATRLKTGENPFGELKEGYYTRVKFNLGKSIRLEKNQYVTDVIATKMTVSMKIGLISLAISLVLGVVLGVLQAIYKAKILDHIGTAYTVIANAVPRLVIYTIIMIAGAGMLIAVAVQAGTIEALSNWIGSNVPAFLVPIAFSIVGAIMSFFSSTTGVVAPALFPLIPGLAASTGLSATALFACTVLGAQSSAISPFSSGGSLIMGSCGDEEERNTLFTRLLFTAVPLSVILCAAFNFVVAMVL